MSFIVSYKSNLRFLRLLDLTFRFRQVMHLFFLAVPLVMDDCSAIESLLMIAFTYV